MKKVRVKVSTVLLAFALVAGVNTTFTSCSKYDDTELRGNVTELDKRVSSLEEWQKKVNSDITSIKSLLESVQNADYITDVTEFSREGKSGYDITFKKHSPITIYNGNGASGDSGSVVGIEKGDNGRFYWTVDGKLLTDGEGHKIPTSGLAPQVRINPVTKNWEVSTDNGINWEDTGFTASPKQGDTLFKQVDNSNSGYVEFTLSDGTSFQVARYDGLKIGRDASNEELSITYYGQLVDLKLPSGLKAADYTAIVAEVRNSRGSDVNIQTRAAVTTETQRNDSWLVTMDQPTVAADGTCNDDAKIHVYTPTYTNNVGEKALLEVSIIYKDGSKATIARTMVSKIGVNVPVIQMNADGTYNFWDGTDLAKIAYFRYGSIIGLSRKKIVSNLPQMVGLANTGTKLILDDYKKFPTSADTVNAAYCTIDNFQRGLGDPCRLAGLSKEEIEAGVIDNHLWRMPTLKELGVLKNGLTGLGGIKTFWGRGSLAEANMMPFVSAFSSASGIFYGEKRGIYWAAVPSTPTSSYALEISESNAEIGSYSTGDNVGLGFAIRCVRQ